MFEDFIGNQYAVRSLERVIEQDRIPQTLLFHGPEGVGKATLARRFGAALLGGQDKIEQDDLSLDHNVDTIAEREKLPSDKRAEDPLLFATFPDFITFPPDGPLRQISIQQMRLLKERGQFLPLHGRYRIFLIDHLDRANNQAANSLLKTLEEPPDHLILIATAENVYDLLPTIRSRAVPLQLSPLTTEEVHAFVTARGIDNAERRVALSDGSPGTALTLDLETYDRRREAMLALLGAASRTASFASWAAHAEKIALSRSEKLDPYLKILYGLLEDLVLLHEGGNGVRNADVCDKLDVVARAVSFAWLQAAVRQVDELIRLLRRNIQKSLALDALVIELRKAA
ncbi:MAG: NACHT domain-containing protein [bacterium]|nr:NACHT domain-containing protein [bacterium]